MKTKNKIDIKRRKTRTVRVGKFFIGSKYPILVQSMTNTATKDITSTLKQIKQLEDYGCQAVRVSVRDKEDALAISKIKPVISIPLIADIHFDVNLAFESIKNGADKIRINPGNIGDKKKLIDVIKFAKDKGVSIRIGVNAGSIRVIRENKVNFLKWTVKQWADEMVKEAIEYVDFFEKFGFKDIIVSLKADDVERTVLANKIFAKKTDIPLHIGITEAGPLISGLIKSTVFIYKMLSYGIGDTIRVSLTDEPYKEVVAGFEILKTLGFVEYGPTIISCPTCGRCEIDLIELVKKVEEKIYSNPILRKKAEGKKIAIMGCIVNGPGEAKYADFGICGGKGKGVWIENGKCIKVIKESEWLNEIIRKIMSF
ncbi:MAG: flavodoxin-dependent (E)-4-hydroxy-3-methylbut-2-enyl-diphosphate synthase [Elusimicrobiales bacterium]|nr:flavodoxin-dependent (E)-4-hydroxy-3-methylbut-2-enyl-diphosphate synthase [Elusimicrobiales bacterium]